MYNSAYCYNITYLQCTAATTGRLGTIHTILAESAETRYFVAVS